MDGLMTLTYVTYLRQRLVYQQKYCLKTERPCNRTGGREMILRKSAKRGHLIAMLFLAIVLAIGVNENVSAANKINIGEGTMSRQRTVRILL